MGNDKQLSLVHGNLFIPWALFVYNTTTGTNQFIDLVNKH